MILCHKIALDPTDTQWRYFAKAAGCARFVWNLALAEWNRRYEAGEKNISGLALQKSFNEFKYEAFPWMKEIHRDAHARPFINLGKAFSGFFNKTSAHPVFHKKGRKDSFYIANDQFVVDHKRIRLPRIGWIKMRSELRFDGKIMGATVLRIAQRWFVAIQVDVGEYKKKRTGDGIVGADLGINSALALSTGEKIEAPKPLKKALRKLKRIQRKQSRQVNGGSNRKNTVIRVARIHARVANIRRDFWHKVSTRLCRENQAIAVEDLNVRGMVRNRRLAQTLSDVGFGALRPMLEYKSKIYGNEITIVNRWFPSSKTCSVCGFKKDKLSLKERYFSCESCGATLDRDVNAAINLKRKIPTVCGESMPVDRERLVKAPREAGSLVVQ